MIAAVTFMLDPAWPRMPLGLGTLALGWAVLLVAASRSGPTLLLRKAFGGGRLALVLALRLTALAVTVLLMLRPSFAIEDEDPVEASRLIFLIDGTRSMAMTSGRERDRPTRGGTRCWRRPRCRRSSPKLGRKKIEIVQLLAADKSRSRLTIRPAKPQGQGDRHRRLARQPDPRLRQRPEGAGGDSPQRRRRHRRPGEDCRQGGRLPRALSDPHVRRRSDFGDRAGQGHRARRHPRGAADAARQGEVPRQGAGPRSRLRRADDRRESVDRGQGDEVDGEGAEVGAPQPSLHVRASQARDHDRGGSSRHRRRKSKLHRQIEAGGGGGEQGEQRDRHVRGRQQGGGSRPVGRGAATLGVRAADPREPAEGSSVPGVRGLSAEASRRG